MEQPYFELTRTVGQPYLEPVRTVGQPHPPRQRSQAEAAAAEVLLCQMTLVWEEEEPYEEPTMALKDWGVREVRFE